MDIKKAVNFSSQYYVGLEWYVSRRESGLAVLPSHFSWFVTEKTFCFFLCDESIFTKFKSKSFFDICYGELQMGFNLFLPYQVTIAYSTMYLEYLTT